jgi:hypothetical protein
MLRWIGSFVLAITSFVFPLGFVVAEESRPAAPIAGDAAVVQSTDLYWVTFSGDCGCDDIFIMQIDSNGNVTIPPTPVLSVGDASVNTSALSLNGTDKLNFFHWDGKGKLTLTVIDKTTLKPISNKKTKITTQDGEFLQVTQKDDKNFIIGERKTGQLAAFELGSTYVPKSKGSNLDTNLVMANDEASISSDGFALITNRWDLNQVNPDELYLQLLAEKGVPTGTPTLLAKYQDIEATDVTDPLAKGKRYVVYIVDSGTTPDDQLYLQKITSSGKKSGKKILINTPPNREEDAQVVAIDPLGRFVIFTVQGDDFGCYGQDILVYQGLSKKGKKSGGLKPLASCDLVIDDIRNLDLVKE